MARCVLHQERLGPTVITGGGAAQTLGSIACSLLTSGMSNNTQLHVEAHVSLFDNSAAGGGGGTVYASRFILSAPMLLTAGPTYTLGTVATLTYYTVGGGGTHTAATMDISAGNLRVRITPNGDDLSAFAVVYSLSP